MIELQTRKNQTLTPAKIFEYLDNCKKEPEKCVSFIMYALSIRAKYLQIVTVYYLHKNDRRRVEQVFNPIWDGVENIR